MGMPVSIEVSGVGRDHDRYARVDAPFVPHGGIRRRCALHRVGCDRVVHAAARNPRDEPLSPISDESLREAARLGAVVLDVHN